MNRPTIARRHRWVTLAGSGMSPTNVLRLTYSGSLCNTGVDCMIPGSSQTAFSKVLAAGTDDQPCQRHPTRERREGRRRPMVVMIVQTAARCAPSWGACRAVSEEAHWNERKMRWNRAKFYKSEVKETIEGQFAKPAKPLLLPVGATHQRRTSGRTRCTR